MSTKTVSAWPLDRAAQQELAEIDDGPMASPPSKQVIANVDANLRVKHIAQKNRGTILILVERLVNGQWHFAGQEEIHLGHFIHQLGVSCNYIKERLLNAKMNDLIEVKGWNLANSAAKE